MVRSSFDRCGGISRSAIGITLDRGEGINETGGDLGERPRPKSRQLCAMGSHLIETNSSLVSCSARQYEWRTAYE